MMCVPAEPTVNEVIDPIRAIENLKRENKYLKEELVLHDTLVNRSGVSYDPLSEQQLYEIENQCRRYVDGSLDEMEIHNVRQVQGMSTSLESRKKALQIKDILCLREKELHDILFFLHFSRFQYVEEYLSVSSSLISFDNYRR